MLVPLIWERKRRKKKAQLSFQAACLCSNSSMSSKNSKEHYLCNFFTQCCNFLLLFQRVKMIFICWNNTFIFMATIIIVLYKFPFGSVGFTCFQSPTPLKLCCRLFNFHCFFNAKLCSRLNLNMCETLIELILLQHSILFCPDFQP